MQRTEPELERSTTEQLVWPHRRTPHKRRRVQRISVHNCRTPRHRVIRN